MDNEKTLDAARADAWSIWRAGVAAVDAARLVRAHLALDWHAGQRVIRLGSADAPRELIPLSEIDRLVVIGAGKAGAGMAAGAEEALREVAEQVQLTGWLNVPADCVRPLRWITLHAARPAGLNEPTEAGVQGSERILQLVGELGPRDLCVALISGGGSALMPAPLDGITLADKQQITRFLSGAGANIQQLNIVRQRLSRVKGGGLARACRAGRMWSLIISDVLGDPLDIIASGATVPRLHTASEALEILERFEATKADVPAQVWQLLREQQQAEQLAAEQRAGLEDHDWVTPSGCVVRNRVIGNNAVAVAAAAEEARRLGYHVTAHSATALEGPAEEIGRALAEQLRVMSATGQRAVYVSGGEPVVRLVAAAKRGRGGRNQQLVLAAAADVESNPRVAPLAPQELMTHRVDPLELSCGDWVLLSGGTDGEDGPTDAAGAWMDASILEAARKLGLNSADYLRRNDAYHFFEPLGALLKTGPTHTNVCDLRIVVTAGGKAS